MLTEPERLLSRCRRCETSPNNTAGSAAPCLAEYCASGAASVINTLAIDQRLQALPKNALNMMRARLIALLASSAAALRPIRQCMSRRDLGSATSAAVAALAPAVARAEPRDQWIAAQKEIDAILAASARVLVPTHRTRSTRRSTRAGLADRGRRRRHPAAHRHRRHDESVV